jgi:poly(3-hydroxybutyrate) depolymerase
MAIIRSSTRVGVIAGLLASVLACASAGASSGPVGVQTSRVCAGTSVQQTAQGKGCVDSWNYTGPATTPPSIAGFITAEANSYLVYTPANWNASEHLPLYVMVHGCATTGAQQMQANLLNPIADRERFVVAYPDNGGKCWPAVAEDTVGPQISGDKDIIRGGGGAADALAAITRQVTTDYHADANRVYMIGMSSGSFQTSATAASYPDLYAAVGESAGAGYGMSALCAGYPPVIVPSYARAAVKQMGPRSHVMPFFAIGGTTDALGNLGGTAGCVRLAYQQWLYSNNLLAPAPGTGNPGACGLIEDEIQTATGSCTDKFQPDPSTTAHGQVPGGYSWTRQTARGPGRCEIAEDWIVNGMGHYWSGGSTDPQYAGFTDPKGPNASQLSWDFFKRFTLKDGNTTCRAHATPRATHSRAHLHVTHPHARQS